MSFAEARLPNAGQEAVEYMIVVAGRDEKELIVSADEAGLGQFQFALEARSREGDEAEILPVTLSR